MIEETTNPNRCPRCGNELPPDAPGGVCPRCAFAGALESQADDDDTQFLSLHDIPPPGQKVARIGDYELLEIIARGGMGVVYQARQRSLNRVVALKLLLGGTHASEDYQRRFRQEAETAARLQHPNIVPIYEVGEHEGQPFFTMEYVAGSDLAKLTRDHPLPPKPAAEFVKTVAEAIHYAHQQKVLHRDLKPSNILVGLDGRPRITDFGLARQADAESSLTVSGAVLGTPGYLPPEQASLKRGAIGAPSDVYALGAVLYHLLTGRPPFLAGTVADTLQQVLEVEPVTLRRLNRAIPQDLETICHKCLEKDAKRRYATAQALADELGRFLDGKPIQVRRVTAADRALKWARRNPALALACGLVALSFVGGTLVSLWQARVARQEARKTGQVADFLETMLGGLQPDVAQSNDTKLIRIILTNATTRMDKELAGAPEVAARLKDMVGRTYLAIAEMPAADFYLTQALAMRRKLYPRGHTELASSLHNVASLRRTQGEFDEAEALQREFLTMLRKAEGEAHPDLATGLNSLGELIQQQPGRLAEATSIYREALARHERRTDEGEHKDLGLAATTGNLAVALQYQGQLAEAEALYRRALQLWQQPSLAGRPAAALPMASLAALLLSQGKAQEAEPLMRQALALQEATLPARHPSIAITLNNLGVLLRNRGDYTEAEAYHRRALDIQRHADNPQKPSIVNALIKLGQTLAAAGKLEEAEALLEEALALQRELGGGGATASAELLKEIQGIRTKQTR